MNAEAPALVSTFKVGARTVTLTMPRPRRDDVACMAVEWAPSAPRRLSARELHEYRQGRDAALAELGVRVLVVEV